MSRVLYFVRHGETEWNRIKRMQGQWNSNLNALGQSQADENGRLLAGLGVDAIYCSPLDRTRQTAEIVTRHLDLPVIYDDRLKEWDSGDWSGHMYADIPGEWPSEWEAWHADRFHYRVPGGENYPDMFARARPFLEGVLATEDERIAIISHGMIGRVMISILMAFDEAETLAFGQANDVVFRISMGGERPEAAHFKAGKGPFDGLQAG